MTYRPRRIHLLPRHKRAKGKRPRVVLTARPDYETWAARRSELVHDISMQDPAYRIAFNLAAWAKTFFVFLWHVILLCAQAATMLVKLLPDLVRVAIHIAWLCFLVFGVYVVYTAATAIQ